MMASTCLTSSGCTPKPMSTSLICSSCHVVGGEQRDEALEGRAALLGAELDAVEQLAADW